MTLDARATSFGWVLSLLLHAGIVSYVMWSTSTPDVGFDFQLPDEVEFGLTEAMTVTAGAPPATPEPPSPEAADEGEGEGEEAADAGPSRDAGPYDAGRYDGGVDAGPELVAEADPGEGEGEEGAGQGAEGEEGEGVAFLPAGSQIALRMDVTRVRESPLADDVRELLAVMPDWQVLLGDSGIDPLADLDRLLIASPNLNRSRMILAGRAVGDQTMIRAAAERLATARGEPIEWQQVRAGVLAAPWRDASEVDRVIAIVGPRHFVISRRADLTRVLAVAAVRAQEAESEGEPMHPADALLSMEEGEGLSLEVEGARNFARARPGRRSALENFPTSLRLAILQLPEQRVGARTHWTFETEEQASAAAAHWDEMREGYARNVITRVLGLGGILDRARIEADGDGFDGTVDMELSEMRRLLGLSRGFFTDRAAARARQQGPEPTEPEPTEPTPPRGSASPPEGSPSEPSGAPTPTPPSPSPRPPPSPFE